MALRPFEKTDLEPAFQLDQVCFAEGIAYRRWELRYFVSRPSAWSIVAEMDGEFAGFVIATSRGGRQRRPTHIVTVDVAEVYRRCGIASALLAEVESRSRAEGCKEIVLEVAVNNEAALQFYRRLGFVQTGVIEGYYNGVLNAATMEKKL